MKLRIVSISAVITIGLLAGCAEKRELTREQRVDELRREAKIAERDRQERQEAQNRHMAQEAALERPYVAPPSLPPTPR